MVGGNEFSGPLPPLAPTMTILDASYNQLSGEPTMGAYQTALWQCLLFKVANLPWFTVGVAPRKSVARTPRHTGPLPTLPSSMVALDVSSNGGLEGDITSIDVSGMAELRLGNNSFTGGVPPSAAQAP